MLKNIFSLFNKKINTRPSIREKDDSQRIEEIFAELKDIKSKKARLERHAQAMEDRQADLEKYQALTQEDHSKIAGFLNQYKNVMEQIKILEGRLIRNNPALRIIQAREKEIPAIIEEIRQTENNQRYASNDMLYLEDEKNYLYQERQSFISAYKSLKTIAIGLIIVLGVICLVLLTMVQVLRENIFIPSSILALGTLFFGIGILVAKRRIEYELELNEIMQQKASKLLNRTKIRYYHHSNYLNYQYSNLSIKNSDHLQAQYQRYLKNKNNEVYYKNMNDQLMEIEHKVFDILYEKGIQADAFDNIDQWTEVQNISLLLKNISDEYQNTKRQIAALETYEEELCKEAYVMTEISPEIADRVAILMEGYMNSNGGKI